VLALQAFEHRALEEKAVGEDPQLATVNLGDALDQVEDVATEEGFAAREVEASDAELGRLVDQRPEPLGAHSLVAVRARRHQAVLAREVARVVRMQPQLTEPRLEIAGPARVRGRREGFGGREAAPGRRPEGAVHVQPSLRALHGELAGITDGYVLER